MLLAARFASGAPLGRRRTDATFLSAGTRALAGMPGWFTTAEPGWWAFWPGWKRAAVRWATVAAAAGLNTHPLVTGAVLGWLALGGRARAGPRLKRWRYVQQACPPGLPPAGPVPRHRPGRQAGPVAGHPAGLHRRAGRGDHAGLSGHLEPRCRPAEPHRPAHPPALRRDLVASFGAFQATWAHPPAPPERAPFDGYDLPAHRIHLATLAGGAKWIADLQDEEPHLFIAAGTGGGKTATAVRPGRARAR